MEFVNTLAIICQGIFGAAGIDVDSALVSIIHWVYLGIQVVVPILLIIFGMLDLAKALTAQKEDEIKKAQSGLAKKAIVAVIVFLVTSLVGIIMGMVAGDVKSDQNVTVWQCANQIIKQDATVAK